MTHKTLLMDLTVQNWDSSLPCLSSEGIKFSISPFFQWSLLCVWLPRDVGSQGLSG